MILCGMESRAAALNEEERGCYAGEVEGWMYYGLMFYARKSYNALPVKSLDRRG